MSASRIDRPRRDVDPTRLTPRQRLVLVLVADGLTTKEISKKLGLNERTVDGHRWRLMRRLGIHTVAGLTRYAVRHGIVDP